MNSEQYLNKLRADGNLIKQLIVLEEEYNGPCGQSVTCMMARDIKKKAIKDARLQIESMAGEISRLQAEREKLPKTADGVVIYPGMNLFGLDYRKIRSFTVWRVSNKYTTETGGIVHEHDHVYSTAEAAVDGMEGK